MNRRITTQEMNVMPTRGYEPRNILEDEKGKAVIIPLEPLGVLTA